MKNILSIETSCDDTSVAIVNGQRQVICCLVASQDLVHEPFGGVVPEIASRNHSNDLVPLVDQALQKANIKWSDVGGIAVTNRPGLVGSLIVGLVTAKTLALAHNVPFLGVHHIEGHIMAPFLKDETYQGPDWYDEDFMALVVSGGHTQIYKVSGFGNYEVLGQTIDDAAGEAFDKFAKMMGLGYPGGVAVDKLAQQGDPKAFAFPRPLIREDNYQMSFSGLKTAAQRQMEKLSPSELKSKDLLADLSASYQQAIVDVLIHKVAKAFDQFPNVKNFVVSGGVSANSGLRKAAQELANQRGINLAIPPLRYCTDNAAMIGIVGVLRFSKGEKSTFDLGPQPRAAL